MQVGEPAAGGIAAPVVSSAAGPSAPAASASTATTTTTISGVLPAERRAQFEQEISRLGVKGGNPEPERWLVIVGVLAVIGGFAVAGFSVNLVLGAGSALDQNDGLAQVILGVGIALVGAVLWARYSLSRYLRYWLVRDIYESRAATDRIVEAIERHR